MKFDFEFFKNGNVFVHVKNRKELKTFLTSCKNTGMLWRYGTTIFPENHELQDYSEHQTCFYYDVYSKGLTWRMKNTCAGYMVEWADFMPEYIIEKKTIRKREQVKNKELLRSEIRMSEKIKDIKLDIEILKDKIEKISDVDDFLKYRESIKYGLGELERNTTEYEVYKALAEGLREGERNGQ